MTQPFTGSAWIMPPGRGGGSGAQTPAASDFTNTNRGTDVLGMWRWPLQLGPCSLSPGSGMLQLVVARPHADSSSSTLLLAWWPLPNSRGHALDPDLSPRPHPDPLGVTASPSSLLHLHTRRQDHLLVQLLPLPTVRPRGVPASLHHDPQRNARIKKAG